VATSTEIADRANLYCMKGGKAWTAIN
jgi:hypothetical protein